MRQITNNIMMIQPISFRYNEQTAINNYYQKVIDDLNPDKSIADVSNLVVYGWKKEAIPITQTKNSLIARIFKSLFG